jgi:hypothetical protein
MLADFAPAPLWIAQPGRGWNRTPFDFKLNSSTRIPFWFSWQELRSWCVCLPCCNCSSKSTFVRLCLLLSALVQEWGMTDSWIIGIGPGVFWVYVTWFRYTATSLRTLMIVELGDEVSCQWRKGTTP